MKRSFRLFAAAVLAAGLLGAAVPSQAQRLQDSFNSASGYAFGGVQECVIAGVAAPCALFNIVNSAPAVTVSAAAYAAGNTMGGLVSFTGTTSAAAGAGVIKSVLANFSSGVVPNVDVVFFNLNPSASTITNNTAFTIAAADKAKIIGVAHISDCTLGAATTMSICQNQALSIPFKLGAAGTVLYAAFVTRTAITLTSTSDLAVSLNVEQH